MRNIIHTEGSPMPMTPLNNSLAILSQAVIETSQMNKNTNNCLYEIDCPCPSCLITCHAYIPKKDLTFFQCQVLLSGWISYPCAIRRKQNMKL